MGEEFHPSGTREKNEKQSLQKGWNPSPILGIPPNPGHLTTRPREGTSPRSPLAELDGGTPSFVGDTEGFRVGEAGLASASVGGPVAIGRASVPRDILKPIKL